MPGTGLTGAEVSVGRFVRVTEISVGVTYSASEAPVRTMFNVPVEDCFAVKMNDVVRVAPRSPTTHVLVPPDVALQAPFVRPKPDVSVAVTVSHGLHDAVSVTVTVWPTESEIEATPDSERRVVREWLP